jgi:hypothetical protein
VLVFVGYDLEYRILYATDSGLTVVQTASLTAQVVPKRRLELNSPHRHLYVITDKDYVYKEDSQ